MLAQLPAYAQFSASSQAVLQPVDCLRSPAPQRVTPAPGAIIRTEKLSNLTLSSLNFRLNWGVPSLGPLRLPESEANQLT